MEFLFLLNGGKEKKIIASSVDEALRIIGDGMNDVIDILVRRPTKRAADASPESPLKNQS